MILTNKWENSPLIIFCQNKPKNIYFYSWLKTSIFPGYKLIFFFTKLLNWIFPNGLTMISVKKVENSFVFIFRQNDKWWYSWCKISISRLKRYLFYKVAIRESSKGVIPRFWSKNGKIFPSLFLVKLNLKMSYPDILQ